MFDILIITLSYCFKDSFLVAFREFIGGMGGRLHPGKLWGLSPPHPSNPLPSIADHGFGVKMKLTAKVLVLGIFLKEFFQVRFPK